MATAHCRKRSSRCSHKPETARFGLGLAHEWGRSRETAAFRSKRILGHCSMFRRLVFVLAMIEPLQFCLIVSTSRRQMRHKGRLCIGLAVWPKILGFKHRAIVGGLFLSFVVRNGDLKRHLTR